MVAATLLDIVDPAKSKRYAGLNGQSYPLRSIPSPPAGLEHLPKPYETGSSDTGLHTSANEGRRPIQKGLLTVFQYSTKAQNFRENPECSRMLARALTSTQRDSEFWPKTNHAPPKIQGAVLLTRISSFG
jgi:hypothetical protein